MRYTKLLVIVAVLATVMLIPPSLLFRSVERATVSWHAFVSIPLWVMPSIVASWTNSLLLSMHLIPSAVLFGPCTVPPTSVSVWPFRTEMIFAWDGALFSRALRNYNVIPHFPQPNGEPAVLIATGRADAVEMIVQWPMQHAAELRALVTQQLLPAPVVEEVVGVDGGVAQELRRAAVKAIRSGLKDHI